MKTFSPNTIPDRSNLSQSLSSGNDITINGAKMLFDHKVSLMPVNLEEIPAEYRRNRKRNGRR